MILSIKENPFRVLGVFANATLKEITANQSRLKAYAKVGKTLAFPADMVPALPSPVRNLQAVEDAASAINLPADKIKHALFYFVNTSSIDDITIKHIQNGSYDKAFEILSKKKCFSSLLNSGVLSLSQEDIGGAVENISELIHNDVFRSEFSEAICGPAFKIDADTLAKLFIDELLIYVSAPNLLATFKKLGKYNNDINYLLSLVVNEPIALINKEIEKAKNCGDSASEEYLAALKLIKNTELALGQLKQYFEPSDLQYQTTVDALARQILQCGINYFNASDDEDDVDKALAIQKYALSIAISELLKDRCQDNVDTLINIESERPPKEIREENNKITSLIDRFNNAPSEIKYANELILDCSIYLTSIKEKIGKDAEVYIKLSTVIAHLALQDIISELNNLLEDNPSRNELKEKVILACQVIINIGVMDIDRKFRNERYIPNRDTLWEISFRYTFSSLRFSPTIDLRTEEEHFKSCNSFEDYENYLQKYKNGKYRQKATKKYSLLKAEYDKKQKEEVERIRITKEKETQIFKACKSISDYENYLKQYPYGLHKSEAKKKIDSKKQKRKALCWIIAILIGLIIISAIWDNAVGISIAAALIVFRGISQFKDDRTRKTLYWIASISIIIIFILAMWGTDGLVIAAIFAIYGFIRWLFM